MENSHSFANKYPELAKEWHPIKNGTLKPADISYGSSKKVWWYGKCGHEWDAKIANRTINKRGCPYCSGRKVLVGFNDLNTTHPELSTEWHPSKNGNLLPTEVSVACKKKIWWLGMCGHEWDSYIYNRKKGHGCPYCSGRKILAGFNDLATTNLILSREWHLIKNNDLTPNDIAAGSHKKVWWLCDKEHEWKAEIKSRAQNHGCPYCSNQKIWIGFNDLAFTHPHVAKEWHPTKNKNLTPQSIGAGSTKKVWWKCEKGHEWKVKVVSRTTFKTGCPTCAEKSWTSFPEQVIFFYFKKVTTAENRNREYGKEIDIYLPNYKIGIEHNGEFYHQDKVKDQEKVDFFKDKGIRIISVYTGEKNVVRNDMIEYIYNYTNYDSLEWAVKKVFEVVGLNLPTINILADEKEIRSSYMY